MLDVNESLNIREAGKLAEVKCDSHPRRGTVCRIRRFWWLSEEEEH
jgi:hypothetical protein